MQVIYMHHGIQINIITMSKLMLIEIEGLL